MPRIPEIQAQVKPQIKTEEDLRLDQNRVEHTRIENVVVRGD